MEDRLFEQLQNHIDQRFDQLIKTIEQMESKTSDNMIRIAKVESKIESLQSEVSESKIRETDQHKEFYSRLGSIEKEYEKVKTLIWVVGGIISLAIAVLELIIK